MKFMKALLFSAFAGLCSCSSDTVATSYTFETDAERNDWTGWALNQKVDISTVSPGYESGHALRFAVASKGWDTPILKLKTPVPVTENTMLSFKFKGDADAICQINLQSADGVEYTLSFPAEKGRWIVVRKRVKDAIYKRYGKEGLKFELLGDRLSFVQIAHEGREALLDNFSIYEADTSERESPEDLPPFLAAYRDSLPPLDYPVLRRNGVFPFGVVSTVNAGDRDNGALFGQGKWERFEDDLLDMKRMGLNTVANFCDDKDVERRLDLMGKYRISLIETAFSCTDLYKLPPGHESLKLIERHASDPRLLAWYGRDEPGTLEIMEGCLKNKAAINKLDKAHPFASTFNTQYLVRSLGPFMETVMIDIYSISGAEVASDPLRTHGVAIRNALKASGGGRCWFVTQAFGGRCLDNFTWRYPTPEEIRFDMYNSVACGASGLMFFIYNDAVTWLDGQRRGEEFDDTLVDAWGNGNAVYDELSDFGRRIVPIMPSLLDASDSTRLQVVHQPASVALEQRENKLGSYLFFINKDLAKGVSCSFDASLPEGRRLYDLERLAPLEASKLDLRPGEGRIVMAATPEDYATVKREITGRRLNGAYELAEVELDFLKTAKLETSALRVKLSAGRHALDCGDFAAAGAMLKDVEEGTAKIQIESGDFLKSKALLAEVQRQFGRLNSMLTRRDVILKVDGTKDARWLELFGRVKSLSGEYFKMRDEWRHGGYAGLPSKLSALLPKVETLNADAAKLLSSQPK